MTGRPDRHGWNSWEQYESTHNRHMRHFDEFVVENNLVPQPTSIQVVWDGRLICRDGFEL